MTNLRAVIVVVAVLLFWTTINVTGCAPPPTRGDPEQDALHVDGGVLPSIQFLMALRARYLERCNEYRPEYTVNIWGEGALKVSRTYNERVRTAVIFSPTVTTPPDGIPAVKLGKFERYDADDRDDALNADAFETYLKALEDD